MIRHLYSTLTIDMSSENGEVKEAKIMHFPIFSAAWLWVRTTFISRNIWTAFDRTTASTGGRSLKFVELHRLSPGHLYIPISEFTS